MKRKRNSSKCLKTHSYLVFDFDGFFFSFSELKEKRDELVRKKSEQQVQGGQVETA